MFAKRLLFRDLHIRPETVYREMGYVNRTPDPTTVAEVRRVMHLADGVMSPRYCYRVEYGRLEGNQLQIAGSTFLPGRIIASQLEGSEAFALFLATAGEEWECLRKEGDALTVYVADALATAVVERCADVLERDLQASIDKLGWRHTNRFSPGYCQWDVAQQHLLVPMLGEPNPCGIRLTDGALMWPVKSVSGIIGLGKVVQRQGYRCANCQYPNCFRRKLSE